MATMQTKRSMPLNSLAVTTIPVVRETLAPMGLAVVQVDIADMATRTAVLAVLQTAMQSPNVA